MAKRMPRRVLRHGVAKVQPYRPERRRGLAQIVAINRKSANERQPNAVEHIRFDFFQLRRQVRQGQVVNGDVRQIICPVTLPLRSRLQGRQARLLKGRASSGLALSPGLSPSSWRGLHRSEGSYLAFDPPLSLPKGLGGVLLVAAGAAFGLQAGANFRRQAIIAPTPFWVRPNEIGFDGLHRLIRVFQRVERNADNVALHVALPGLARWIAQGKIQEDEAGRAAIFNDIPGGPDNHCRNAVRFKMACNQTHGLVAHGSKRGEDSDIRAIRLDALQNFWRMSLHGHAVAVDGWGAEEMIGQSADPAFARKALHCLNRQEALTVVRVRAFLVPGCVHGEQGIRRRGRWASPNMANALGVNIRLAFVTGCCDERNAAIRQRLFQRRERRVFVVRPDVILVIAHRPVILACPLHIRDGGI